MIVEFGSYKGRELLSLRVGTKGKNLPGEEHQTSKSAGVDSDIGTAYPGKRIKSEFEERYDISPLFGGKRRGGGAYCEGGIQIKGALGRVR